MNDWKTTCLKEVSELITKGTTPTSVGGQFTVSGINFIKSESLNYEGILDDTVFAFIDEDSNKKLKRSIIKENDILFSIAGIYLGKIGIVKKRHLPANTNQACAIIRLKHEIVDYRFIKQYFTEKSFINYVNSLTGQAAQPNINLTDIGNLKLLLPPLPTQQRIASILSAYDDLIEVNNQRIKLLEETARELYKEWFVRMRFPGYKKAKFVKGVPEGWEVKKLGEVIELAYGKALKEEERKDGEFLVYGSSGIVGTHTSCIAKAPGIVVGRKGNVGSVFWVTKDFYPIDTAFFVKTKISLYYCYFNLKLQNFIEGDAAVPGLNRNQAYSLFILIPTNNLLQKFDNVIGPIFEMVSNLENQNTQLRQIRDRLLPRLISGKLEVKELLTQSKEKV